MRGLALCLGLGVALLIAAGASPRTASGTFPPGYWCGKGLAPVGAKIKLLNVELTIQKGSLQFDLLSSKGDSHGSWEAILGTNGITTPLARAIGKYTLVGGDDLEGTAVKPETHGSWRITGKTYVKTGGRTRVVPFETRTKKWKAPLVIDLATLDREPAQVSGHWLHARWKWTARESKPGKPCST